MPMKFKSGKKDCVLSISSRQEVSRRCLFSKLRAWKSRVKKGQTDLLHLPVVKVGKQYKKIQLTLWGDVCILIMPTGQQCYDCAPDIWEFSKTHPSPEPEFRIWYLINVNLYVVLFEEMGFV